MKVKYTFKYQLWVSYHLDIYHIFFLSLRKKSQAVCRYEGCIYIQKGYLSTHLVFVLVPFIKKRHYVVFLGIAQTRVFVSFICVASHKSKVGVFEIIGTTLPGSYFVHFHWLCTLERWHYCQSSVKRLGFSIILCGCGSTSIFGVLTRSSPAVAVSSA